MKPLIGITCRLAVQENGDRWYYLQKEYSEAVAAAGGIPVQIPLLAGTPYAGDIARRLDAIVLSGSDSDIDPARYGAERHPKVTRVYHERDALDADLVRYARETRTPLLGICYGCQALNVEMGGSLVQHLETGFNHTDREARHPVAVEAGTVLARVGGAGEHRVNTSHHQALDRVASGLRIAARAHDGTIEAVETVETDRFLLAVQWHPERIWQESEISRRLFEELVQAAARRP